MLEVRYARISFQLDLVDCTHEMINSWFIVLDDAVNWSTSCEYSIFHSKYQRLIGVSLQIGFTDQALLEAGTAVGLIKSEVVMSKLNFDNLWFSIQKQDTDVLQKIITLSCLT